MDFDLMALCTHLRGNLLIPPFFFFQLQMVLRDKKEERRILIRKIVIITFLVMIVIGFTVPGILDFGDEQQYVPPRMCQNDADCYLECDGQPVATLCSQNLCSQNSCEEKAFYLYNATPLLFTLGVKINGKTLNLANRSNANDFFVKFSEMPGTGQKVEQAAVYASNLALKEVLEKARVQMSGLCVITNQSYCTNEKEQLQMFVNGNASYSFGEYVPQAGDKVEVVYS